MPNTPFEDLYTAAAAMVDDASTAAVSAGGTAITAADTNYGTDFRITPGAAQYQVQISPEKAYPRATVNYPRAIVTVLIHHYVSTLVNEKLFLYKTMSYVADKLLVGSIWRAESGIYDLEPEIDPEIDEGARTGNVISFAISASVLMTAV
jgi:hypothetical protein